MKTSHGRLLTVLLAALVVLAGAGLAAYAANGGPLATRSRHARSNTCLKSRPGSPYRALHGE